MHYFSLSVVNNVGGVSFFVKYAWKIQNIQYLSY